MKKKYFQKIIGKKNKGVAIIEFVLSFLVFVLLLVLLYTSWGVVHASILNSISARAYAFSIINRRSSLLMPKDHTGSAGFDKNYSERHARFFYVIRHDPNPNPATIPQQVSIDFLYDSVSQRFEGQPALPGTAGVIGIQAERTSSAPLGEQKTKTVHLKQGYGICLTYLCTD